MLSEKMLGALNDQFKWEMESAYLYLGMAAFLADKALPGFAHWMRKQAVEEMNHAMKIYNYIEDHDHKPDLQPIPAPPTEWENVNDVVKKAFGHEQFVTGLIYKLVELAAEEKDYATSVFLQWFVTEQVEEEKTFRDLLDKLSHIGPACGHILRLDEHMGKREATLGVIEGNS